MIIAGYIGAILVGLSLGLIGGGGSILIVPILVYLFSIDPVLATAYSLFIVSVTSMAGTISHLRMGNVNYKAFLYFGVPSIVSIYLTRHYLLPAIPDPVVTIGGFVVSKALAVLVLFAGLMIAASYKMISKTKAGTDPSEEGKTHPLIVPAGLAVGLLTGLLGAGGGFIIIPSLIFFAGLPMKKAVGTSLSVIAVNAMVGFIGNHQAAGAIDWTLMLSLTGLAIVGIITGSLLSKKVSNEKLKPAFGWFVLAMGIWIIIKELILKK